MVNGPPPEPVRTAWLRERKKRAAALQNELHTDDEEDHCKGSISSVTTKLSLRSLPPEPTSHFRKVQSKPQKKLTARIKAAVDLSVKQAHKAFGLRNEDQEDADEVPLGLIQRDLGSPIGDKMRLTTGGSASLLGTVAKRSIQTVAEIKLTSNVAGPSTRYSASLFSQSGTTSTSAVSAIRNSRSTIVSILSQRSGR